MLTNFCANVTATVMLLTNSVQRPEPGPMGMVLAVPHYERTTVYELTIFSFDYNGETVHLPREKIVNVTNKPLQPCPCK